MIKKINLALASIILFVTSCTDTVNTTDGTGNGYARPAYYGPGIGLGTLIAVLVSWSRNKSILWAIVHGILGWFYVIYAILVKKKD